MNSLKVPIRARSPAIFKATLGSARHDAANPSQAIAAHTFHLDESRVWTPKQALETYSAASCGVLYPPLCGIVQLTNSATLRFRNWSFTL